MEKKPAYIDVKQTVWIRITLDENVDIEKLKNLVKNDCLFGDEDLYEKDNGYKSHETLDDTTEYMRVEKNDNQSTIEVYDSEGNILFTNIYGEYYI